MKLKHILSSSVTACAAAMLLNGPAWAVTGLQVGASGKTYASATIQCALHPEIGMAPMVQAGLYNPKSSSKATVWLDGVPYAMVTFYNPDTSVWLVNGVNTIDVSINKRTADSYSFDASSPQPNVCIPDTSGNEPNGDLEYAKNSYATGFTELTNPTVPSGCALNARTGQAQPYIHLFNTSPYLLTVSVNNVPLTQLDGTRHTHTPVFLSAGWNVISAANASVNTSVLPDYYVRWGGDGTCQLP